MSDYTNTTDGVSGKGLLVAVILMGLFILGLAFMGGSGEISQPEAAVPAGIQSDATTQLPASN